MSARAGSVQAAAEHIVNKSISQSLLNTELKCVEAENETKKLAGILLSVTCKGLGFDWSAMAAYLKESTETNKDIICLPMCNTNGSDLVYGRNENLAGGTDAISVSSTVAARIPGMPTVQFRGRSLKHQSCQLTLDSVDDH